MPVTARLSLKFYERFGEDIATELVNWFNDVDATYRGDLRELNELNFARFDAKLEQRAAQMESKLEQSVARLETRLIRWMFGFWTGAFVTIVGTLLALGRLGVLVPR